MTPEQSIAWHPDHPGGSTDILPFFTDIAHRIPEGGTYLEIGTFFGRSLSFMGILRPDLKLIAVDPWELGFVDAGEMLPVGPDLDLCQKHGGLYEAFLAMMKLHAPEVLARTRIIRAPSRRGLRVIDTESVDFTFIDGDHGLKAVVDDCREAQRITKKGGIIAGHDMLSPWGNEVTLGVRQVFGEVQLAPWPVAREGWEPGCSSVFFLTAPGVPPEARETDPETFALDAPEDPASEPVEPVAP
jgi:Methyltransferase domain